MAEGRRPNIVLLVVIAIAVLALAAVLIGGSGDDDDSGGTATSPSSTPAGSTGSTETRAVRVAGGMLPPFEGSKDDPAVGMTAPVVSGTSFGGDAVSIGGKGPALIVFVAHWCPHCQREVPRLVEWFGDGLPGGVALDGVATDIDKNRPNYPPSTWLEREHWTFPTLVDDAHSQAAQAFGLTAFPYFVAIDGSGKVVARGSGELEQDAIEALAKEASS